MRIAVLADVHGNLPALEAVLDDVADARSAASDYPGIEEFVARNVRAAPSDAEALAVFSARARS